MWFTWQKREGCGDESVGHPLRNPAEPTPRAAPILPGMGDTCPSGFPIRASLGWAGDKDWEVWPDWIRDSEKGCAGAGAGATHLVLHSCLDAG